MKGAVSYSLFGYGQTPPKDCFAFDSYLRGLMVNVRVNRIIYPQWMNIIHTDKSTYTSKYKAIFDWLIDNNFIEVVICPEDHALTMKMLWRMKPIFERVFDESAGGYRGWKYTHVLCRDIDSVCTYREAQAVKIWQNEKKTIHCITDSISHNIPMMGGMIGIDTGGFADRVKAQTWDELMGQSSGIDYSRKGADQTFLNKYVYPKCCESSTEHFVLGMKMTVAEGDGRHYSIEDIPLPIPVQYKAINDTCGHIGSSGYYENVMLKFLNTLDPYAKEYADIERQFPTLFFWRQ